MFCRKKKYLYQNLFKALGILLQSNPLSPERKLLGMLPLAFKRRGQIDQARQLFDLAAEVDPKKAHTLQPWAIMEKEKGNFIRARELFEQAAKANLKDPITFQSWALMEKELGKYDRARELFEQASSADPKNAIVYQSWALMEKELGKYNRARELFEQAAHADPNHAPVYQAWALMEKELGKYDRARQLFEQAIQAEPSSAHSYHAWALMEAKQDNYPVAKAILETGLQYVSKRNERAIMLSTLGSIHARHGDFARAGQYFAEALSLDEANPFTHYYYAMEYLLLKGDRKEACQHLHRAQQLRPRRERDPRMVQWALKKHCDQQTLS
jgi:tetratricopeptide (TPR) repeat protein